MKYECKQDYILDSVIYKSNNGVVNLPKKVNGLNLIEEIKQDNNDLIKQANGLGLGSPSTLKRLSDETLKERIADKLKETK